MTDVTHILSAIEQGDPHTGQTRDNKYPKIARTHSENISQKKDDFLIFFIDNHFALGRLHPLISKSQ
jgi:hypothetical protein